MKSYDRNTEICDPFDGAEIDFNTIDRSRKILMYFRNFSCEV